ncbi:PstS family phosphate ABC transporter substrate-binding protein [Flavisolibacter ginsengisoli]|uniref:Phosphate transport system substrate-binding protein n=1 Tax=Flavisolibacter ginsengisoli DSM 18119 TaxID=1121884 RepID=A0A1M5ASW7_9BACT|nr:substrate-binding domain-containing protein [Flavisolibacter ginsengisoli]SHF33236.1 phosphate transport system substrate-binding protein [Flavisolibacter ginsengisoli DSM 18119]
MNFKCRVRMVLLLFLVIFFQACSDKSKEKKIDRFDNGTIYISCDESFKPVIDAEIEVYQASYPDAHINVQYKPEADCLRDFGVDSIRMIIATRGFSESERKFMIDSLKVGPVQATVAHDAIAVIIHPEAKDSFFTMDRIRDLVSGNLKENLIPVFDGLKATSTVRFMIDSVLKGKNLGKNVVGAQSSEGVIDYVSKTPNAVGFIGVSWVGNKEDTSQQSFLKRIRLARLESTDSANAFVLPVQYLIYTKSYPMVRDLVYVLREQQYGLGGAFANFLKSDRGQLIFRRAYLQPAKKPFYVRRAELKD